MAKKINVLDKEFPIYTEDDWEKMKEDKTLRTMIQGLILSNATLTNKVTALEGAMREHEHSTKTGKSLGPY